MIRKFESLINNKYDKIEIKKDIFYNEEIASFTKKTRVLDEQQIKNIYDKIINLLKYKKNILEKIVKDELEKKIKENINFEFKEQYLYQLNNCLDSKDFEKKDINDIIIELIKKNKKDEYFDDEYFYYLTKESLQIRINIEKIKTIMESIEEFNSKVQKEDEIEKMLEKLDSFKFDLDFILSKLEGFINDIQ